MARELFFSKVKSEFQAKKNEQINYVNNRHLCLKLITHNGEIMLEHSLWPLPLQWYYYVPQYVPAEIGKI